MLHNQVSIIYAGIRRGRFRRKFQLILQYKIIAVVWLRIKERLEVFASDYRKHTENFVEPIEDAQFDDDDAEYFELVAREFEKNGKCNHGY